MLLDTIHSREDLLAVPEQPTGRRIRMDTAER